MGVAWSPPVAPKIPPARRDGPIQIRVLPEVRERWRGAASAAGEDLSEWARRILDQAALARTGGAPVPRDAEFGDAIDELRLAYGIRDPAEVVRMAVLAALRRRRAGIDPWLPPPAPAPTEPTSPAPRPAERGRR